MGFRRSYVAEIPPYGYDRPVATGISQHADIIAYKHTTKFFPSDMERTLVDVV